MSRQWRREVADRAPHSCPGGAALREVGLYRAAGGGALSGCGRWPHLQLCGRCGSSGRCGSRAAPPAELLHLGPSSARFLRCNRRYTNKKTFSGQQPRRRLQRRALSPGCTPPDIHTRFSLSATHPRTHPHTLTHTHIASGTESRLYPP
jgi:hypothetical protein